MVRDGKLVGIVSRANLLQGIANAVVAPTQSPQDDRSIREAILKEINNNTGVRTESFSVIVDGGNVEIWGLVESGEQKQAVTVAAENTQGVKRVENHLGMMPRGTATSNTLCFLPKQPVALCSGLFMGANTHSSYS